MIMSANHNGPYQAAIVGGGFSGSMVAVHLARSSPKSRILLFDRHGAFGRGVAYGTDDGRHLLNVPAEKISAFAEEPDHFLNWLKQHRAELSGSGVSEISAGAFVPRQVYGQYVREILDQARQTAPGLETDKTDIVDVEPAGDELVLLGKNGSTFVASKVVLALGNFGPGDPPVKDRRFFESARYLNQPWSAEMLRQLTGEGDVLILGSGLTALDLLVTLDATKPRGMVHVVSRHALFPQAHEPYQPQTECFRGRMFPLTVAGLLRFLRDEVRLAAKQDIDCALSWMPSALIHSTFGKHLI